MKEFSEFFIRLIKTKQDDLRFLIVLKQRSESHLMDETHKRVSRKRIVLLTQIRNSGSLWQEIKEASRKVARDENQNSGNCCCSLMSTTADVMIERKTPP